MQNKDFITYEYRTIAVKAQEQAKVMDMYEAFGWEITGATSSLGDNITLSLKRDRQQKHKQELTRLERNAEYTYSTINRLNSAKTLNASIFAYIFGSIAMLIFGGGMSLTMVVKGSIPAMIGGIILGVVGAALCAANYFIYKKIADKKTRKLLPAIDDNEERLANLLEKGNDLLQADLI